jgi:hypothetical protein
LIKENHAMASLDDSILAVKRDLFRMGLQRLWYWTDLCISFEPRDHQAYGWYLPVPDPRLDCGTIIVPRLAVPAVNFGTWLLGCRADPHRNFADVLRHEYGHALCDALGLMYGRLPGYWGQGTLLTSYAATSPDEDFAECFMLYLKHRGRLWHRNPRRDLARKWTAIERYITKLRKRRDLPLVFICPGCSRDIVAVGKPGTSDCPNCSTEIEITKTGEVLA